MLEYNNKVCDFLEYIGYPDIIVTFNHEDVAKSLINSIALFYITGLSPRMCALSICGMTWKYQILERAKGLSIN